MSFIDGGKELLVSTASGSITRWDRSGKKLGDFALKMPGAAAPRSVNATFLPGGKIATALTGNDLCAYDMPAGTQRCVLAAEGAYSGKVYFDGTRDKAVVVVPPAFSKDKPKPYRLVPFDLAAGLKGATVDLPAGEIFSSALTPDGKTLLTVRRVASGKGESTRSSPPSRSPPARSPPNCRSNSATAPRSSPRRTTAKPSSSSRGTERRPSTAPRLGADREVKDGSRDNPAVPGLFSPDGTRVAVAYAGPFSGGPAAVEVIDWASGKVTHRFAGHSQSVTCLAFSDDGQTLASGSLDTTVLLWDLAAQAKE